MRRTKIICTIGPACSDAETLEGMMRAGMNVARLNFSHGTHEEHLSRILAIRAAREKLGLPIPILLDTKGPEYRIGTFRDGKVELADGAAFTLTTRKVDGDQAIVSVNYPALPGELSPGDRVLINNGLVSMTVESLTETDILCRVDAGGTLSDRKSMSFPGRVFRHEYLSDQDREDIRFGIEQGVDFIACSFVSRAEDLRNVKSLLAEYGGDGIELIAKIENQSGVDNIESICAECDGIMIGRGDLGVEIPFVELPAIQKRLITTCRMLGRRVITATEMLESMILSPRPTRAETSDVANAVYDGTSAIMLSGETAAGKYPVLAVSVMAQIAECTERSIHYCTRFRKNEFQIKNTVDALSHATVGMSIDISASAIAVCTLSGMTARMVSRFRPPVPIIAVTTDEKTWRKLALSWAVLPVMSDVFESVEVLFYTAKRLCKSTLALRPGERIVITGGMTRGVSGNTNLIKIDTIG